MHAQSNALEDEETALCTLAQRGNGTNHSVNIWASSPYAVRFHSLPLGAMIADTPIQQAARYGQITDSNPTPLRQEGLGHLPDVNVMDSHDDKSSSTSSRDRV